MTEHLDPLLCEGVAASATESQEKVERLVALQADLRARVRGAGKRGAAEQLAADLIGNPFRSRSGVASDYRLSGQGAINAIRTLVELKILKEAEYRAAHGARRYVAPEVLEILLS